MSGELWVALIGAIGSIGAAAVAALLARDGRKHAKRAEQNTRPVSNGFASDVRSSLANISGRLGLIETAVLDHLEQHTRAGLQITVEPIHAEPIRAESIQAEPIPLPPAEPDIWPGDNA